MITIAEILKFAAAHATYVDERKYTFSRIASAHVLVDAWQAIETEVHDPPGCSEARKAIIGLRPLLTSAEFAPLRKALRAAFDQAVVQLADAIADIPAAVDADEEAAQ